MNVDLSPLRVAAAVEAGSLLVLVVNRLTVHHPFVTSATGPVHGTAYLAVIALVLLASTAGRRARYAALVPGIGGYLALRLMNPVAPTTAPAPMTGTSDTAERHLEGVGELRPGAAHYAADNDTAVTADALVKDFGRGRVVGPLTFTVPSGSVTGFIGPNGAGKTTTIRMLLGLVRPTGGGATVLGQSVRRPTHYLPSVGALVEGPASYPGLSGRQNLRVHARLGGIASARIDEVLDMVDLADRADDRVSSYSFGMRQRLGIAAALLPRPRLLVLDEPANGLDPHGIADLRLLLRRLADDGTTCLVSSHLLHEIEHTCDHLVALHHGKVAFAGARRDLITSRLLLRPENPNALPALAEVLSRLGYHPHRRVDALVIDAPADDAAGCNRAATHAGITLAELRPETTGLEQAFLALTTGQPQPPTGGPR